MRQKRLLFTKKRGCVRSGCGCFAAIDFETADYGRDSACAVSMVRVAHGAIVDEKMFLIRPPRRDFVFSYIHGITWRHVLSKPRFGELWPAVASFFEGVDFIAAHNSSFDKSVLDACCRNAGICAPVIPFLCTMKLARTAWGIFPTTLPHVCRRLGIELKHHNAASDARACAQIVIEALKQGKRLPAMQSR